MSCYNIGKHFSNGSKKIEKWLAMVAAEKVSYED